MFLKEFQGHRGGRRGWRTWSRSGLIIASLNVTIMIKTPCSGVWEPVGGSTSIGYSIFLKAVWPTRRSGYGRRTRGAVIVFCEGEPANEDKNNEVWE